MRLITIILGLTALITFFMIHEGVETMAEHTYALPPVDRDVPKTIETATFALG